MFPQSARQLLRCGSVADYTRWSWWSCSAPSPSAQEDLRLKAFEVFSVSASSSMPSRNFSISNVNIVAYISRSIVRNRRSKFSSACQDKFTSRNDVNQPSLLFLSLKAYSDAQECLFAPIAELQQLICDLASAYRAVCLNALHMNCVRARHIRHVMKFVKPVTIECSKLKCELKQLIVGMFVNIR